MTSASPSFPPHIDSMVDALCREFRDDGGGHVEASLKVIRDVRIPDIEKGLVLNAYWTRRRVSYLNLGCEWLFILSRLPCPQYLFINWMILKWS